MIINPNLTPSNLIQFRCKFGLFCHQACGHSVNKAKSLDCGGLCLCQKLASWSASIIAGKNERPKLPCLESSSHSLLDSRLTWNTRSTYLWKLSLHQCCISFLRRRRCSILSCHSNMDVLSCLKVCVLNLQYHFVQGFSNIQTYKTKLS